MDFLRPIYLDPAALSETLKEKHPWVMDPSVAEAHETGLTGHASRPTSREDDVYCAYCALWDIDGQSRHYKPNPRSETIQLSDPLAFRYDPAMTNISRTVVTSVVAAADNKRESQSTTSLPVSSQISDVKPTQAGSRHSKAETHETFHHEPPKRPAAEDERHGSAVIQPPKARYLEPALDHDADTFDGNPVYVCLLIWLKEHRNFCRLCHLILNSLEGSPELDHPPWGDDTAVYIDRFEFAVLFDDDKINEDADLRPRPGWPGFDASVMGILSKYQRLRDAKAVALPERLGYRFNVRLDDIKEPVSTSTRRFGIQRLIEPFVIDAATPPFSGLKGRLIGSEEERIRRWLGWSTLCLTQHRQTCFPNFIHDDYPNLRLIDVRRRCIVGHLESRTYTALSYVWGAESPESRLVLKKANFADLHTTGALANGTEGIPKTIRDVLNLCQKVSTFLRAGNIETEIDELALVAWEYLWIDALCIVQDDPVDKQHHINRMDKVYSGAWQTIVAASKNGAVAGLPGFGKEGLRAQQHVEIISGIPFVTTKQSFLNAVAESVWEQRGWTFQEKHLSKRLLVFNDEQCFWHCSCATWYEDTNLELPDNSFPHLRLALRYPDDPKIDPRKHLKWTPEQSDIDRYRILSDSYVRRRLKHDSDGLDSIKAVFVGMIDKEIEDGGYGSSRDTMSDVLWSPSKRKYFWALPEVYLPAFLLTSWTTEDPWSERRNHFPTWSWLSRNLIDVSDEVLGCHIPQAEVTPRQPFYRFDERGNPIMLECVQIYKSGLNPSEDTFDSIDDKRAKIPSIVLVDGLEMADGLNKEHEAEGKNILALDKNFTPPISHLLAFRETTCKLWVDSEPMEMDAHQLCDAAPESLVYKVRLQQKGPPVSTLFLHRQWRRRRPAWLDFVVVTEAADFISTRCLNLLLVEWDGPIARRVQALIAVKITEAFTAHPVERKLVLLA